MLKRRPSKRFVLAETGEESAWNTSDTVDPDSLQSSSSAPSPPTIEFENDEFDTIESEEIAAVDQPIEIKQHLALPETGLKLGIK